MRYETDVNRVRFFIKKHDSRRYSHILAKSIPTDPLKQMLAIKTVPDTTNNFKLFEKSEYLFENIEENDKKSRFLKSNKIYKFNADGILIGEFNSIKEVSKESGVIGIFIESALETGRIVRGEFYLSYKKEFTPKVKLNSVAKKLAENEESISASIYRDCLPFIKEMNEN